VNRTVVCAGFLTLLVFATVVSVVWAAPQLTFWNMPFNSQEVSPNYVNWWEQAIATVCPNFNVERYYGPGTYEDARKNFVLQARTGKPDVIEGLVEDLTVYARQELIADLTVDFKGWAEHAQFLPETVKALTLDGKIYGIPYNTNARVLLYRKDVLAEYDLEVPTTWEEYVQVAATITKQSGKRMAGTYFCSRIGDPRAFQEFISWYYQVSHRQPIFTHSADGAWRVNATPAHFTKVLTLYHDLVFANSEFPPTDLNQRGNGWPEEDNGYVAGEWAMVPMGPWIWGHRKDNPTARMILEEHTAIAPLPIPQDGVPATYLEVKPIMINKYSKNFKEAWDLTKFLTSRDAMAGWAWDSGFLPTRHDVAESEVFRRSWWQQGFRAELPTAVALEPVNWLLPQYTILQAVGMVIYQKKTPEEASQWLYEELIKLTEKRLL
jgi:multiple sugar transport system substrate-binding protein